MLRGTEDLLGQTEVLDRLMQSARAERLHHCYLFEGPPRVGKATAAKRLAMAAACLGDGSALPCGECPSCRQMEKGNHPDLIMLTPDPTRKSGTIGVNQVRELIRVVRLRRYSARWRSVIIDPAEALTPQAANALLKTLEEPPLGTGFILVTSRVSTLLPTVLSRSQRVRFKAVPEAQLVPWLQQREVADAERIARLAMGCPGHALELAQGGLSQLDETRDELLAVLSQGPRELFDYAEKLSRKGNSRQQVFKTLDALETLLRDAAMWAAGREQQLINLDKVQVVQAWSGALWPLGLERLQLRMHDARVRVGLNVNARLLIEALLARVATELGAARRVV